MAGCMFCCSEAAPDSIEHYASCTCLHRAADQVLGLNRAATPPARLADFLGLSYRASDGPAAAVRTAIRIKAAYDVHCLCRHGAIPRGPAAAEAMWQACREAVRGHPRATAIYDVAHGWN